MEKGIIRVEFNDRYVVESINDSLCRLLGYDSTELVGQPLFKILSEDGVTLGTFQKVLQEGECRDCVIYFKTKKGEFLPVESTLYAFKGSNGEVSKVVVFGYYSDLYRVLDIKTKNRRREELTPEKLLESFVEVIENSLEGVIILNENGEVSYLNNTAAELLQRKPEEILKLQLGEVISGGIQKLEVLRPNGEVRIIELVSFKMNLNGNTATMVQVLDVTEKEFHNEMMKHALFGVASALNLAVEKRDPYTSGHSMGVAKLARLIGMELGLSKDQLEGLYLSGILHDIGKIAVPVEILVKPGRLTVLEMEIIKSHPVAGYEILKNIDFPWPVALVALQHHERLDGSGYPKGLKNDEIILEARIVAVADVVDAMIHNRPYRPALSIEEVEAELRMHRGVKYDPEVVDAFLKLLKEEEFKENLLNIT